MSKPKFSGKIRTDPWESLARGSKEVMASLWQEYLADRLGGSPKDRRFQTLRREIEAAADYPRIFREWNNFPPEGRAEAWRQLMATARQRVEAVQESCVRCGDCCERSSPTLMLGDLPLLQKELLTWNDLYTLRPGDLATSRGGKVIILREERLKVRELPGLHQCCLYQAARQACRIYDQRPEQCRRQQCWGEPAPPPDPAELLSRQHLFQQVPEIWDLITAHNERCNLFTVRQALTKVGEGEESSGDYLFEALHFDHYLREMLTKDWDLTTAATELLLGRPLTDYLKACGFKASLSPEGVFRLEHRKDCLSSPSTL